MSSFTDSSRKTPQGAEDFHRKHDQSVLQIRRNNWDYYGIISLICHKNIYCDPSLEPSCQDSSNEGSQCIFLLRNKKIKSELSLLPLLIWSAECYLLAVGKSHKALKSFTENMINHYQETATNDHVLILLLYNT